MAQAAAIGLMVASELYSGYEESRQLKAGARVDEENARRTLLEGALSADEAARSGRAVQGEAIAAMGASGASFGSGFIGDAIFQNALAIEKDILNRRYSAGMEAEALRQQAYGKRKSAQGAMFGGMLRAGAAALTGINQANNADKLSAANARVRTARFPGGQRMPIPTGHYPGSTPGGYETRFGRGE